MSSPLSRGVAIGAVAAAVAVIVYALMPVRPAVAPGPANPPLPELKLPTFASCAALGEALAKAPGTSYGYAETALGAPTGLGSFAFDAQSAARSADYSTTNVQVEGVDEADIVKTDGQNIYMISGNRLAIVTAENRPLLESLTIFSGGEQASELYLADGRLVVIGTRSSITAEPLADPNVPRSGLDLYYPGPYGGATFVKLYDVSNPASPTLIRDVSFEGSYLTSRLIGGHAYLVVNRPAYYRGGDDPIPVPLFKDSRAAAELAPLVECASVTYVEPIIEPQYLVVASVPVADPNAEVQRQVILGAGQTVYASLENLYVARTAYSPYDPSIRNVQPWNGSTEQTAIEKFSLYDGLVSHVAAAEVPGRLLNQFSMDEHRGNLRLATTLGQVSRSGASTDNRIYVLDPSLNPLGQITGIAPGEQIYSARFMGDRGYLVTFKKVDPFFTLDLSDPANPRVAGQLKIPGFSDYLHPFDETHIIGFGKDTVEGEGGNFAWYQGLKVALFDVTDFSNPIELHRVLIGDRGSDSELLRDHKALLFSRDKNLLVFPVQIAEISDEVKERVNRRGNEYGEQTFGGAIVFNVTLEDGFRERGRISHDRNDSRVRPNYYGTRSIRRSLYVGDNLFTVSDYGVKVNDLTTVEPVGELWLDGGTVEPPILY